MKKVLVATDKPFAKIALEQIRAIVEEAGYQLALLEKYTTPQQLLDAVVDANAMIVRSDLITKEVVEAAKELKIVVRAGAGYDNVDLDAATAAGVCVMNTPGQNANAVAELVFGLLIYAIRNFYNGTSGTELKGKKLGIHAYGNVGRNVARIAKGFGMDILAFDMFCRDEDIKAEGVNPTCSVKMLYQSCDIISINIPATKETKQSINAELLQLLPKGAVLVNTARKEVVHEADMVQFMESRPDVKYVTDVMPDNHAEMLEKFPTRYFATAKKMGAQTSEANINAGIAAAKQIVGFLKTGNDKFRVN